MKKNTLLAFGMVITTVLLSSCNGMPKEIKADEVKEETIYMRSDGSSQVAYVEDFNEKYLNLDELKGYISSELSSYNKKYGDKAAVLSEIELKSGKVKAVLTFMRHLTVKKGRTMPSSLRQIRLCLSLES